MELKKEIAKFWVGDEALKKIKSNDRGKLKFCKDNGIWLEVIHYSWFDCYHSPEDKKEFFDDLFAEIDEQIELVLGNKG